MTSPRPPRVLLGVTGCVGAFKAVLLLRLMRKAGWEVRTILTESGEGFVGEERSREAAQFRLGGGGGGGFHGGGACGGTLTPREGPIHGRVRVERNAARDAARVLGREQTLLEGVRVVKPGRPRGGADFSNAGG